MKKTFSGFPRQPPSSNPNIRLISPNNVENSLVQLHAGNYASYGQFSHVVPGSVRDLEWNHMDQLHRLYIHDAYHDSARIATGADFAYSITRWKRYPIFIQVFDVHIGDGMFYQSFSLFGVLICHQVQKMIPVDSFTSTLEVDWMTISHRWLRFLHPIFNRMMAGLQKKQSDEDLVIRERRTELRKAGVEFKTNSPTFLNSNLLSDMLIFPEVSKSVPLSDIPGGKSSLKIHEVQIHFQRDGDELIAWPAICPHEGAKIETSHICEGIAKCPWHGRTFSGTALSREGQKMRIGNVEVVRSASALNFTNTFSDSAVKGTSQ